MFSESVTRNIANCIDVVTKKRSGVRSIREVKRSRKPKQAHTNCMSQDHYENILAWSCAIQIRLETMVAPKKELKHAITVIYS